MNDPLLFDTSVWIDFLNIRSGRGSDLLGRYIAEDFPVIITPVIYQEILQGIQDDGDFEQTKDLLSAFSILDLPAIEAAGGAAALYRDLRKKGITIRKSNDCLIAFYAIYFDIPLVHKDRDFTLIAQHTPLKILL
ncbi:type II toxin-antitoxin system VapC family toxin [Compostibacter hankyongensis]|uniref:Ribonuclease VapC n=1 Tax=Compostibacter hankyongensis TaxID=1007089 RepID=A0ABP8FJ14_9BACT